MGMILNAIAKIFAELITDNGMKFIDLTDFFKAEVMKSKKLYYHVDLHWNYIGQEIASEVLLDQVILNW